MEVLAPFTRGKWANVSSPESEEAEADQEMETQFRGSLAELFRSENLVVLTGLGTSMCIKNIAGKEIAPTMPGLWNAVEERFGKEKLAKICTTVHHPEQPPKNQRPVPEFVPDIELLLSKCIVAQEFEPKKEVRDFIQQAESTIVDLCNFPQDNTPLPVHEAFLRRIARRPTRFPRTKLFTTNYDLAFEAAANRLQFIAVDGFSHTFPQEFDSSYFAYDLVRRDEDGSAPAFIPNVFQLYKLHGSVDWQRDGSRVVKQVSPKEPVLIYPRHSKFELSYESPFLDMMARFQSSVRQTKTSLLIIGFGFNDKHLSQPILTAIRGNVGLRVAVVSRSLKKSENKCIHAIKSLIEAGDSRLTLVAGTFEDFVPYLPDLVPETEEEEHRKRLEGVA